MDIARALKWAVNYLTGDGVEAPFLEAELLLAKVLDWQGERAWILAHPEYILSRVQWQKYRRLVLRRGRREPLAYILGYKEFYGLQFLVNRHVLIPRPETEILLEAILQEIHAQKQGRYLIVDIGTGSGALAVAVAKECKIKKIKCEIMGTDILPAALKIARKNAHRHGLTQQIIFLRGDLLQPLKRRLSNLHDRVNLTSFFKVIILANLPYLPTTEWRATALEIKKWEPRGALDGGKDGLKYYRQLFQQLQSLSSNLKFPISIFCELCPHQFSVFTKLVRARFPNASIRTVKDLSDRKRVAVVRILKN